MLAAATLLAACDGSNLFEGNVAEDPPRITAISAPAEVTTPASFDIDIFASAPRGVALVEIEFSGAFVLTDEFDFDGTKTVEIASGNLTLDQAVDSLLIIRATVEDVNGRVSAPRLDTVRVN